MFGCFKLCFDIIDIVSSTKLLYTNFVLDFLGLFPFGKDLKKIPEQKQYSACYSYPFCMIREFSFNECVGLNICTFIHIIVNTDCKLLLTKFEKLNQRIGDLGPHNEINYEAMQPGFIVS